jgi:hypothetical protein
MTISFTFRFSAPLAITLRRPNPVMYSSWVPSSKWMSLRSTLLQKPLSGPEASRHSESAAQTCQDDKGHSSCPCYRQHKFVNVEYDQGMSRSPFLDAALTAIMGIGIGEPHLGTALCCFLFLPRRMAGCPSLRHLCLRHDVGRIFMANSLINMPKHLIVGVERRFFHPPPSFTSYSALTPIYPSLCGRHGVLCLV